MRKNQPPFFFILHWKVTLNSNEMIFCCLHPAYFTAGGWGFLLRESRLAYPFQRNYSRLNFQIKPVLTVWIVFWLALVCWSVKRCLVWGQQPTKGFDSSRSNCWRNLCPAVGKFAAAQESKKGQIKCSRDHRKIPGTKPWLQDGTNWTKNLRGYR